MKTLFVSLAVAMAFSTTIAGSKQGPPMPTPPKELKLINWLKGDWDANLSMFENGKNIGTSKGPVSAADSLGGMYLESKFEVDMGGMKMTGLQLTTYDSNRKEFVAYWFDSMAPGLLEMRGKLSGQTLVLTSKPTAFPGMPGKNAFRATNSLKSATTVLFRLEINSGKGWSKMMEGMMTRK
jgi:hypothetical protein